LIRIGSLRIPNLRMSDLRLDDELLPQTVESLQLFTFIFKTRATPQQINRLMACRGNQPCAWICRKALRGPSLNSRRKSFLHRFLGQIKAAEEPDQRSQNPARLLAIDLLDVHRFPFVESTR